MNLTGPIESAELQFKRILEEFFISVYDERKLPSHGLEHHRRVWSYVKELITILPVQRSGLISTIPSKLIIASYLHDIGMSLDNGVRHGKHSRDLCSKFLSDNNLQENYFLDVLEAIENHDRKDYPRNKPACDLLTILSTADDLDAFGFTGIYRYLEIYIKRSINPEEIGHLIKDNAAGRFDHFMKNFGFIDTLVQKHKLKYGILVNFFNEYDKQRTFYKFGVQQPAGYCGVVELLIQMMNNQKEPAEFFTAPAEYPFDPIIQWFFDGLKSELW